MDLNRLDALPQMDIDSSDHQAFEARLDQTVRELRQRVEQQQRALEEVTTLIPATFSTLIAPQASHLVSPARARCAFRGFPRTSSATADSEKCIRPPDPC